MTVRPEPDSLCWMAKRSLSLISTKCCSISWFKQESSISSKSSGAFRIDDSSFLKTRTIGQIKISKVAHGTQLPLTKSTVPFVRFSMFGLEEHACSMPPAQCLCIDAIGLPLRRIRRHAQTRGKEIGCVIQKNPLPKHWQLCWKPYSNVEPVISVMVASGRFRACEIFEMINEKSVRQRVGRLFYTAPGPHRA